MTNKADTVKKTPAKKAEPKIKEEVQQSKIDPLLDCLVFLTDHFGRPKSEEVIKAGLAYDEEGMGPDLFCEAARKLLFKTKITKRKDLAKITKPVLPVVLILEQNQACVLVSFAKGGKSAKIYFPESGGLKEVKLKDLKKAYTGYSIFIHPLAEFKDPEAPHIADSDRHWFWAAFKDNMSLYWRVIIAAVLINLFALTSPIFIMNVYDRVIPNNAIETGWVLAIGALTIFFFDFLMKTLRGYFIDLAGRRIDVIVSRRIFDQVLDMKLEYKPPSSGVFASMLREFESVRDFLTSATLTAVVDLPFIFFFLLVIYYLGGPIALLLAVLVITVLFVGILIQIPLRGWVAKSLHAAESKHGVLVESIQGLETIKAISADGRMRSRYGAHVGEAAAHGQHSRFYSSLGVNISATLQQSATILIVLLGMYLVKDAEITMGALIACVILGGRAIAPIGQIANLMTRYHQSRTAFETLKEIMAQPVERPADTQFLHRPILQGKITLDSASFTYPGTEKKVLDNISFTINEGEKVGIIGRIGSGKSTMAKLIMGLYTPQEGALMADDTDYRQIDPADLRRNIAYISQDVVLFRGSVRENIAMGKPQASEDEILKVSKLSGVHEFISRHPMGYDAPVGERGDGLSGGQRQAIALARAMLLQPNIMVCDEPTNSMDMQAEEAFTLHIKEQVRDKTLILITHRQHLLALVDRLILVDQGKIVIDGPRDDVLKALAGGKVEMPAEGSSS
jgi:ATP-binding cassette subfamily C protein LapB